MAFTEIGPQLQEQKLSLPIHACPNIKALKTLAF